MKNASKATPGPWSDPIPTGSSKFEIQTTVNQKQFKQRVAIVDRLEDAHLIKAMPEMLSLVTEVGNFLYSGRFEDENGWIDQTAKELMGKVEELLSRISTAKATA